MEIVCYKRNFPSRHNNEIYQYQVPSNISIKQTRHASALQLSEELQFLLLDDDGPQKTEAQDDFPGNRWLDLIAIQSEVAQPGNVVADGVVHGVDGDGADVAAVNTWEDTGKGKF